ncbi:MAG: helix-turn-helix domain-containing protein [Solirubrobacterales bacterium]
MNAITKPPRGRRRRTAKAAGPDPVDVHVGARVKLRRVLLGLTQIELAAAIGMTFQQVQKYERGTNRISASMLHRIARQLDVPVGFFFDDMPDGASPSPGPDEVGRRESLQLIRHFHGLPQPVRRQVYQLVKALEGELPAKAGE